VLAVHRLTALSASLALMSACAAPASAPDPASGAGPAPGAGAAVAPVAGGAAHEAASPVPSDRPGVQADGEVVSAVKWFEGSLEEAQAAAKAANKRLFVDVGAYWCPPCRKLDEEVFTRPEVGEALGKDYVAVHIDAEKGEGPDVVARYRVQAYPTLLVLEAGGLERGRIVDALAPAELLTALGEIARGGGVLTALEAAVKAAPDDLEARYRLGNAYALAARRAEAEAELAKVIAGDPDNARGLAAKAMSDRAAFLVAKQDGDPEKAIALYRELQKKFPQAKESLRAYRAIGRELHKLGRDDEAIASLEAMVAAEPANVDLKSAYGWFCFRERCRPAAGLKAVDAGVALDPKNADLHYLRAELKHQLGDAAGAAASIREAAAIEPESAFYKRQVRRFADLAAGSASGASGSAGGPTRDARGGA
jgi:tetratricopeptide (TPR) repeat protein